MSDTTLRGPKSSDQTVSPQRTLPSWMHDRQESVWAGDERLGDPTEERRAEQWERHARAAEDEL